MTSDEEDGSWPRIPGFHLESVLGEGMSGRVYLGHHADHPEPLAVKVLTPELQQDPEATGRFRREAGLLLEGSHPALVPLLAADPDGPVPYLAFRFMQGGDLRGRLEAEGPLEPPALIAMGIRLAGALEALHQRHILHRDLKPENVLFDRDGQAFLSDLGLGKAASSVTLTTLGSVMGSLPYLPPEVFCGAPPSPAGDLFGLGLVLLEASTGVRSLPSVHGLDISPELAARVRPPALLPILRHCLRTSPEDRPDSAGQVLEALARLAA